MIKLIACLAVLLSVMFMTFAPPARGDGGPIVPSFLYANLKEGQQVAIIRIFDRNTAWIDLFVSILDQTGNSHDISYFVPLGVKASNFSANEEDSFAFNRTSTLQLDTAVYNDYTAKQGYVEALFAGALLTNGVWLAPLWLPLMLNSCASPPTPLATFQTPSSQVSIFSIDPSTDLQALVSTTGLDPSVTQTLSRLEGQQIAVVHLRTQPASASSSTDTAPASAPGLHLSWLTTLQNTKEGATYAYPLGTGASWSHPIDMTRVYVVCPTDLNFAVQYPRLGTDLSGFSQGASSFSLQPRIANAGKMPAYAVDKADDVALSYGRAAVWRAVFTNSNSSQDILITVRPGSSVIGITSALKKVGPAGAFFIGAAVAILFWVLSWILLMPWLIRKGNRKLDEPWDLAFSYIALNGLLMVIPGGFFFLTYLYGARAFALVLAMLCFGGVAAYVFAKNQMRELGVSVGQAVKAFAFVTLASSAAYLVFAVIYAKLVGAI